MERAYWLIVIGHILLGLEFLHIQIQDSNQIFLALSSTSRLLSLAAALNRTGCEGECVYGVCICNKNLNYILRQELCALYSKKTWSVLLLWKRSALNSLWCSAFGFLNVWVLFAVYVNRGENRHQYILFS